jgi:hypothetical protein
MVVPPGIGHDSSAYSASGRNQAGFRVLLTRDRLFEESAGRALANFPELSVVIIRLPQARASSYLAEFRARWQATPISPESERSLNGRPKLCPLPDQYCEGGRGQSYIFARPGRRGSTVLLFFPRQLL